MDKNQNLIPLNERTKSEQRAIAKKGGLASGESRRSKANLKMALERLLENNWLDEATGETLTGAEILALRLFEKAMKGNVKAFEMVRDSSGQKPVDTISFQEIDPETVAEVERLVLGELGEEEI